MFSEVRLPLALGEVSPGVGFTRMHMPRYWGFPEGIHSGGPFLSPTRTHVWKPLDVLPYPNAPHRVPTKEEDALILMANAPGFPRNWEAVEQNGRRWLVRKLCYLIPEDVPPDMLTREHMQTVEAAQRGINAKGWEIGDKGFRVALDTDTYEPFILDLSSAHYVGGQSSFLQADEHAKFEEWALEIAGCAELVTLRRAARKIVSSAQWHSQHGTTHHWVYGSYNRPISSLWARIPDAIYVSADKATTNMWTWVVVPGKLDEKTVQNYELCFGWGPIEYNG